MKALSHLYYTQQRVWKHFRGISFTYVKLFLLPHYLFTIKVNGYSILGLYLNEYIHVIHVRIVELATLKLFYLYEGHQEKRGKKQKSNKQYKVKKCPVSTLWYFIPNKDEVP